MASTAEHYPQDIILCVKTLCACYNLPTWCTGVCLEYKMACSDEEKFGYATQPQILAG